MTFTDFWATLGTRKSSTSQPFGQIPAPKERVIAQRLLRSRFLHLRTMSTSSAAQLLGILFQEMYAPQLTAASQLQFSVLIDPVPGNTPDHAPPLELGDWTEYLKTDVSKAAHVGEIGNPTDCPRGETVIQRLIRYEFTRRRESASTSTPAEILHAMFVELFASEEAPAWREYFFFRGAPIARRVILSTTPPDTPMAGSTVAEILSWICWQDERDPAYAAICDLHYFGGLGAKTIGRMLRISPHAVLRALRFNKKIALLKLPNVPSPQQGVALLA